MSDKIETGGAAFPVAVPSDFQFVNEGMTLRDYFAAKALTEIMKQVSSKSGHELNQWMDMLSINSIENREDLVAYLSYMVADAMIAARGITNTQT